MQPAPRRWFTACVGHALLAALLVCPVMAVAGPAPAASGCHDEGRGEHGDHEAALTCCATIIVPASIPRANDNDAGTVVPVDLQPPAGRPAERNGLRPPRPTANPPLFLRHAALLI